MSTNIATTIKSQIGVGSLMSVGASGFIAQSDDSATPGLGFTARLHPYTKTGNRSTAARKMTVWVNLTADDLYRVRVRYGKYSEHTHFETDGIYADQLPRLILSLDSGTEQGWNN